MHCIPTRSVLQPVFPEHPIQPSSAQHPSTPSTPTPPLYLLGNVLLTFGDRRSSGTGGFELRAQLVQSRAPLRIAVHGVSVEDWRWGLGAAQRRHFKPRETEWKILEERQRTRQEGETDSPNVNPWRGKWGYWTPTSALMLENTL